MWGWSYICQVPFTMKGIYSQISRIRMWASFGDYFFLSTLLGLKKILWFSLAEFLHLIINSVNILIVHIINLRYTFKKEEEEVFFFFSITAGKIIFHPRMNYPIDHSSDYLNIKVFLILKWYSTPYRKSLKYHSFKSFREQSLLDRCFSYLLLCNNLH